MKRNLIITATLGLLGVILGAFGAHILKERLDPDQLKAFETGIRYQLFHVLVLLFVNTYAHFSEKTKNIVSLLFFTGILFFSGSIYLLTTSSVPSNIVGPITPIGGLFLIAGWLLLTLKFVKNKNS